jgi:hypothetical protein
VEEAAVDERHRPEPVVLAPRDGRLVELKQLRDLLAAACLGRERDEDGHADDQPREGEPSAGAAALGEVAAGRAGVAGLLRQPAEAVRDLGSVGGRCPALGFPVCRDRSLEVTVPDPSRSDVAPRGVRRRCIRQLEDRFPGADGGRVVIEAVEGLAEPQERRAANSGIGRRGHTAVLGCRVRVIAGCGELAGALEELARGIAVDSSTVARLVREPRVAPVVGHRAHDTRRVVPSVPTDPNPLVAAPA